jgi:cell division topological specificity factor
VPLDKGEIEVDFLRKLFGGGNTPPPSAQTARDRIRLVLIHDRTDISPQLLENLRREMITVLTKYMDIDESKIEMDLGQENNAVALVANIPVLRIKRGAVDPLQDTLEDKLDKLDKQENNAENKTYQRLEPTRNSNIRNRRHK